MSMARKPDDENCLNWVRKVCGETNQQKKPQPFHVTLLFYLRGAAGVYSSCTNADWQPSSSGAWCAHQDRVCHRATNPPWPCVWVAEVVLLPLGRVQLSGWCLPELLPWGASVSWLFGHHAEVAALAGRVSLQLALLPGWFWTAPSDSFCISVFMLQFCPCHRTGVRSGLMGVKAQENTAWWVHIGQNSAVSSVIVMASSCIKPLAGLRIMGGFAQLKEFLSKAIIVLTSPCRIQEQAIFIWIDAVFAISNNGKTCQAPRLGFPALV